MFAPEIILGSGLSGLLVAQRLKQLGRPFLILERDPLTLRRMTESGFLYLHERITGKEPEIEIVTQGCPNPSAEKYAAKVYGDSTVSPVSIKTATERSVGYQFDVSTLIDGLDVKTPVEVSWISIGQRLLGTEDGRVWKWSRLHSTLPMPVLAKFLGHSPDVPLRSKTIWVSRQQFACHPDDARVMTATYCAGACHPWYRKTHFNGQVTEEYTHNQPAGSFPVRPGKIWLDSATREFEKERLESYCQALESMEVYTWGRYARWMPKLLTHQVHKEVQQRLT